MTVYKLGDLIFVKNGRKSTFFGLLISIWLQNSHEFPLQADTAPSILCPPQFQEKTKFCLTNVFFLNHWMLYFSKQKYEGRKKWNLTITSTCHWSNLCNTD